MHRPREGDRAAGGYARARGGELGLPGQRISHAIVMTDALNIHDGTLKLKKDFLQRRAA